MSNCAQAGPAAEDDSADMLKVHVSTERPKQGGPLADEHGHLGEREFVDESRGRKPPNGLAAVDIDAPVALAVQSIDGCCGGAMYRAPRISVCGKRDVWNLPTHHDRTLVPLQQRVDGGGGSGSRAPPWAA